MDDYLMKFGFSPQDMGLDSMVEDLLDSHMLSGHGSMPMPDMTDMPDMSDMLNMPGMPDMHNMPPTTDCTMDGNTAGRHKFSNTKLDDLPLTMAYVPFQKLGKTYEPCRALEAGTLFPDLDKPFLGKRP